MKFLRILTLLALLGPATLFVAGAEALTPAAADGSFHTYGKVVSVTRAKKTEDVLRFDLQPHGSGRLSFKVTTGTKFIAHSSQAEVNGFTTGDFAYVIAHTTKRVRIADSVEYDAHAFHVYPVSSFSGVASKVAKHNAYLIVQLADSSQRKVFLTGNTAYYQNGQPSETPIQIKAGDHLQIEAEHQGKRWVALSVDDQG
ncbi:MAG TPA: hypothetical protein VFB34_09180 [Chloroflexota bacterium]|nr:hypothetical protein [Chloroflexota bacterium]